MPGSERGFIAIDIDGTALVERIDKHPLFGLSPHAESHVRQALIEYILAAQREGYDIVVLTKRPEIIEPGLSLPRGTKPTKDIVYILSQYGIHVKEILRAPVGLKGNKMQNYLLQYEAKDAIGILFDDQLKQVMDVRNKRNPRLMAFDINSSKDLEAYANLVPLERTEGENNQFHPQTIIHKTLERNDEKYSIPLRQLKASLGRIEREKYATEIDKISAIIDDLCVQLYETEYRDYLPETAWVLTVIQSLNTIVKRLASGEPLTHHDIAIASGNMCHTASPSAITPNSACEVMIKDLLVYITRIPLLEDIRHECIKYYGHLNDILENKSKKLSSHSKMMVNEKIRIVTDMMNQLSLSNNPTESLKRFTDKFTASRSIISNDREGTKWWRKIRSKLVSIFPFLASEGAKFSAHIDTKKIKQIQEVSQQTNDRSITPAEVEEDPESTGTKIHRIQ